jgi:hypothetical protein
MKRYLIDLWATAKEAPTGLGTIMVAFALMIHARLAGSAADTAFLWPVAAGAGVGLMLALEYRASVGGTAVACGFGAAWINELLIARRAGAPLLETNVLMIAMVTGLLAGGAALLISVLGRHREQGADAVMFALLPVLAVLILLAL